jgi:hypothetical protein
MRGSLSSELRWAARVGPAGRRRYVVGSLETRRLLAASLVNLPTWTEQGPGPITNGQTNGLPDNPVSGAVNAIAINPANTAQVFIGIVHGGIWRTNNINASPLFVDAANRPDADAGNQLDRH